jgi:hypothetical protein
MHTLNLQVTDTADCSVMMIRDASVWDPNLVIQNAIVEIQPPLGDCFFPFTVTNPCGGIIGFSVAIACSSLGLCCPTCLPTASTLPDGNYNIKFSVDPNLQTIVEFNYFRNCDLTNKYIGAACWTRGQKNDLRPDQYNRRLKELQLIRELVDGSKWMAEEALHTEEALLMYNEAIVQLSHYTKKQCI